MNAVPYRARLRRRFLVGYRVQEHDRRTAAAVDIAAEEGAPGASWQLIAADGWRGTCALPGRGRFARARRCGRNPVKLDESDCRVAHGVHLPLVMERRLRRMPRRADSVPILRGPSPNSSTSCRLWLFTDARRRRERRVARAPLRDTPGRFTDKSLAARRRPTVRAQACALVTRRSRLRGEKGRTAHGRLGRVPRHCRCHLSGVGARPKAARRVAVTRAIRSCARMRAYC